MCECVFCTRKRLFVILRFVCFLQFSSPILNCSQFLSAICLFNANQFLMCWFVKNMIDQFLDFVYLFRFLFRLQAKTNVKLIQQVIWTYLANLRSKRYYELKINLTFLFTPTFLHFEGKTTEKKVNEQIVVYVPKSHIRHQ